MLCFRPSIENINGAQWQIREQLWCDLALLNDNKVRNEKLLNEHELHARNLIFSTALHSYGIHIDSHHNQMKPNHKLIAQESLCSFTFIVCDSDQDIQSIVHLWTFSISTNPITSWNWSVRKFIVDNGMTFR